MRLAILMAALGGALLGAPAASAQSEVAQSDFTLTGSALAEDDGSEDPVEGFVVEAPEVIELGWGWSQARNAPIPTACILFQAEPRTRPAQTSSITIEEVSDSYTLAKAMNASATASLKGFGVKVDGKAEFARNSNVSTTSVSYLVEAEVLNSAVYAAPVVVTLPALRSNGRRPAKTRLVEAIRLTPWAETMARNDIERFQDVCGEGYVAATLGGARAYLLSVTETSSETARTAMRASVTGEGWGQKVSAAAGKSEDEAIDSMSRSLSFYQQGGGVGGKAKTALPEDAKKAIDRIRKLAIAAAEAPRIFEVQIEPYEVLENFPRDEPLLADPDEYDEFASVGLAFTTIYGDLSDAMAAPGAHRIPTRVCADDDCRTDLVPVVDAMEHAEGVQDVALHALADIERQAAQCLAAEADCVFREERVRSPYAALVNLPLPGNEDDLNDHLEIVLRGMARSRCAIGAQIEGCISNGMIRAWAARRGLATRSVPDPLAAARAIQGCKGIPDKLAYVGDADDPPDQVSPVLWHAPGIAFDGSGMPVCPTG